MGSYKIGENENDVEYDLYKEKINDPSPTPGPPSNLIKPFSIIGPKTGQIPVGSIIMWSFQNNPPGWFTCDGKTYNGIQTPDLQGRFVISEGKMDNNSYDYEIAQKGGAEKVALTSASELPGHSHSMPGHTHNMNVFHGNDTNFSSAYGGPYPMGTDDIFDLPSNGYKTIQSLNTNNDAYQSQQLPGSLQAIVTSSGQRTNNEGNSQPHENRPPYYVLRYLMFCGYR